jgi:hypothetical protein
MTSLHDSLRPLHNLSKIVKPDRIVGVKASPSGCNPT